PIILPTRINTSLASGGDILLSPGTLTTAGGALSLAPGNNGAVKPIASVTDVTVAPSAVTFAPGSNLAIAIDGKIQYDQLRVQGDVNLTGAILVTSGAYVPAVNDVFIIVNNQGPHPITGTFNGLPDGAIIANFLGSPLSAVISYDGNFVTLTVKHGS